MHGVDFGGYAYGMWTIVVINVALFLFFVIGFVKPQKKFEWRSMGIFIGFIAALFTEMYGIPLTIYFLTSLLGNNYPVFDPFSHSSGHLVLVFLGVSHSVIAMTILHIITNGLIVLEIYLLYKGWKLIHDSSEDELVIKDIYSRIRHPQYTGVFLITTALLIQWPTLITILMWPVLMFAYYRLSKREEGVLASKFGHVFYDYKNQVSAFFPFLNKQNKIEFNKSLK